MKFSTFYFLLITLLMAETKEIKCSQKNFVCYDEFKYYQCEKNTTGHFSITGYLQSCPPGLICNDLNVYECEEDISTEFLTDQKYYFKFSDKEGRRHIIDE